MYIDSSSTLKLGRLSLSKIGNGTSTANVVYLHYAWRKLCYIHLAWVVCIAYSKDRQPRPQRRISQCTAYAFFVSSLGNRELLEGHLVAFFASRSVTSETERRCIAWAESICKTDYIVISGFHSHQRKRFSKYYLIISIPLYSSSEERYINVFLMSTSWQQRRTGCLQRV